MRAGSCRSRIRSLKHYHHNEPVRFQSLGLFVIRLFVGSVFVSPRGDDHHALHEDAEPGDSQGTVSLRMFRPFTYNT